MKPAAADSLVSKSTNFYRRNREEMMLNRFRELFVAVVLMLVVASAEAQQASATPSERLINIAPCRLVDTRVNAPADGAEETARKIDVASTRCGRFVPSSSTAYALRITS